MSILKVRTVMFHMAALVLASFVAACGGGGDTTMGKVAQTASQADREHAALLHARAVNIDAVGRIQDERSGKSGQ